MGNKKWKDGQLYEGNFLNGIKMGKENISFLMDKNMKEIFVRIIIMEMEYIYGLMD